MPHDILTPVYYTIEGAVHYAHVADPSLKEKEVAEVYQLYGDYFKQVHQGKDPEPPGSTIARKERLCAAIWENLLGLEESPISRQLIDGSFAPGGYPITSLEEIYTIAFKDLKQSLFKNRKMYGDGGYYSTIAEIMNR
ncbi:MAG: hypothetical protein WBA17_14720 [Saprospiraceae bacterium]